MARDVDLVFSLIGKDKTGPAFKAAGRHADGARGKFDRVGVSMRSLAKLAGGLTLGAGLVAGTKALAGFAVSATAAASDLGEVRAANEQVFGAKAARELDNWAAAASTALGQTQTQALDAARTFGVFGSAAGLTDTALSGFSMELANLATDLASFQNTSPEEAVEALGAALRGESEPMRRYGVLLDDATLKARAAEMGIYDGTGALNQQQKVLAAHAEILAQTNLQQGDFARTSGGMANQLRVTSAVWGDVKAAAGEAFVPLAEAILPAVNEELGKLLAAVQDNMPQIQETLGAFGDDVVERWPEVRQELAGVADSVGDNWPSIVDTAGSLAAALERVSGMAGAMWSAFQALPPEVQDVLALLAVAKTTGVLSVAFKATDLLKSLVAQHVSVFGKTVAAPGAAPAPGGGKPGAKTATQAGRGGTLAKVLGGAAFLASGRFLGPLAAAVGASVAIGTGLNAANKELDKGTSGANVYRSALVAAEGAASDTATATTWIDVAAKLARDRGQELAASLVASGAAAADAGGVTGKLAGEVDRLAAAGKLSAVEAESLKAALAGLDADASVGELAYSMQGVVAAGGVAAGSVHEVAAALRGVDVGPVAGLRDNIGVIGPAAGLTAEQLAFMGGVIDALPAGASMDALTVALQTAGAEAGLTEAQIWLLTAAVNGVPPTANLAVLQTSIGDAGRAAGLSDEQVRTLSASVWAIPQGASVDVLREALRGAGDRANLTDQEVAELTATVLGVPGTANLAVLQTSIADAGRAAGFSDEQVRLLSAAVWNVPRGASVDELREALRRAGERAGLTDAAIDGVTAAVQAVPRTKLAEVDTNAVEERGRVKALDTSIGALKGRTVPVKVSISGASGPYGGGAASTSAYSGGAAGVLGWLGGEVDKLVTRMAPALAGALAGIGWGPWRKPVASYQVSSEWMRGGSAIHYGIDLAAPMGAPVYAASAGRVGQAFSSNVGYGTMATVEHSGGLSTLYAHMSQLAVSPGQVVQSGQRIGAIGSTGDSTGPHLHFETKRGGRAVEPRGFMAARGVFLAGGGMVPVNVSAGEYFVPQRQARNAYPVLEAINAGVVVGPGGPTSDSVAGLAPAGSYVVRAGAVRRNRGVLDRISHGSQYLAGGGMVGGVGGSNGYGYPARVELHISGRVLHGALSDYRRETGRAVLEFDG